MEIILASASSRRKELLKKILKEFRVIPAHIEENIEYGTDLSKIAETLALRKAQEIARKHPQAIVIGADTIVEKGGVIYGKPLNEDESIKTLKELRGTVQNVITGLAILCKSEGINMTDSQLTRVKMKDDISDKEIENYVKGGEGEGKAGGYAVQEEGDKFIEWLKGDYYNAVGLPLEKLYKMLKKIEKNWNLKIDLAR